MTGPLAFTFNIDERHAATAIASLRVAAAVRIAVMRAGIERLDELSGLTAVRLASEPRVGAAGALAVVRAVRWRCSHALPSWSLIRNTAVERLPTPLDRVPSIAAMTRGSTPSVRTTVSGAMTLADVFDLGPEAVARRLDTPVREIDELFDQLARIGCLEPDALRRVSACPDPFVLPAIHPLVIIAAARALSPDERLAALALGLAQRDSTILLLRWGLGGLQRPTYRALAKRFGITSERVRQIVEARERAIASSGLRLDAPS